MKIATWNVNSLRVRLPQVLDWLAQQSPDVLCLQETKLTDAEFPADALRAAGYEPAYAGQKTYNGVATLARATPAEIDTELPGDPDDPQRRLLAATVGDVRVINVYVPNGQAVDSDKYAYKLAWLKRLHDYIAQTKRRWPRVVVLGDFNIAPDDRDVHDPGAWTGSVLVSDPERAAFRSLLELGLADGFRLHEAGAGHYSWWDYRAAAFRRNHGLRIDHILCSDALRPVCESVIIDTGPRRNERPSDHTPVMAVFGAGL